MNKNTLLYCILAALLSLCVQCVVSSAGHGGSCVRQPTTEGMGVEEEIHEEEDEHGDDHDDDDDNYNLNLAIASVFVLWVVSFIGAGFPLLLAVKQHPWIVMAIRFGSFAGSGVMLATAFVHMLYSANENLTSDCLPESWLNRYGPWAFLFACLTIVVMQTIDYILYLFLQPVSANENVTAEDESTEEDVPSSPLPNAGLEGVGLDGRSDGSFGAALVPISYKDDDLDQMERDASTIEESAECNKHSKCKDDECNSRVLIQSGHHKGTPRARLLSNIIISEISICVHSLIIGLTLGLTNSSEFVALFIAIIFHQLLEGVALGSATAESGLGNKVILMFACIYSITTPIGIAIGIGVRQSLDTNSPAMLYTTGVLDSIAAGALIYLSLGDHMNSIRTHAKWLRQSKISIQLACFACFYAGAAVLLVLAIWA
jgi:zinc transporter 1/2/3